MEPLPQWERGGSSAATQGRNEACSWRSDADGQICCYSGDVGKVAETHASRT